MRFVISEFESISSFYHRFVLTNIFDKNESYELKGTDRWDRDSWVAFLRRTSEEGKSTNSNPDDIDEVQSYDNYDEFARKF